MEALGGWSRLAPDHFTADNRFGFQGGAGIDMGLTQHWALRIIQADFMYSPHRFGAGDPADRDVPGSGARKMDPGQILVFALDQRNPLIDSFAISFGPAQHRLELLTSSE